ncbi:UDP-N-acetylglucosamine-N-acetylmuramyl-(pentapeptide)pyrophosphoryl-undecaprenol N-acetylglucosamine transferase [Lactococcus piscium]|uniref:UDP-N-acetylglucosamine--N-acetylmuramyl-(pentapeptide) pyrophosphoryl-undecaprenol N-acetylglucosamine transferase n=2 Tax=Pseudolactococcus TaxID=3436058 RepID=A0A0D6DZ27_9LACT|nr:UDP-N-acetylglucosamine--N-acetylmuramyl-(pentapeptide) pyrophosphoryl-undecaprenol N-acetylglucosamine transferase MurG [Lactococcus piscium MKFS47]SCA92761.1 UDP-N-acetylglucosamine--N-acetylmuramyl-(pentapeptide) pyrophosphoryl-undecaprenol N-acetylglucosamine transferase / GT28, similar to LACPI-1997 from L. piscium MKFS47 [Lactococcus piscium]SOB48643.1 UDP-N-acetylglucosamine-N-acetylmuramyl-(pentapeptide)pyrophosphoryl-undecaprenol N-acetylglucosamine transferase [Lactococcus piscium]
MTMKIIVSGGGTGGHIYPALSFIKFLKTVEPNLSVLYIGTEKGLESTIVPENGIPFKTVDVQGFKRSLSPENVKTVYKFMKSVSDAKKMIKDFKPDIVIGTGGYVAGPVVYAAAKLKIPTIVHEQNSIPGITNKFLSRYATRVALAFQEAGEFFPPKKTSFTGNPRAQEVADLTESGNVLSDYGLATNKKTIVIFGGSRGALKINTAVIEALPELAKKTYQILYASGEIYFNDPEFSEMFKTYNKEKNIKIVPYIKNMVEVLNDADLILSRAGATTLAEITALGLPSILVPSPYVTADHQTKNAEALENAGAAIRIKNDTLTGERIVNAIDSLLLDDVTYRQMAENALREGVPDASQRLYQLVKDVLHGR